MYVYLDVPPIKGHLSNALSYAMDAEAAARKYPHQPDPRARIRHLLLKLHRMTESQRLLSTLLSGVATTERHVRGESEKLHAHIVSLAEEEEELEGQLTDHHQSRAAMLELTDQALALEKTCGADEESLKRLEEHYAQLYLRFADELESAYRHVSTIRHELPELGAQPGQDPSSLASIDRDLLYCQKNLASVISVMHTRFSGARLRDNFQHADDALRTDLEAMARELSELRRSLGEPADIMGSGGTGPKYFVRRLREERQKLRADAP